MNLNIFKNKSILVTGGTGSFGKNFVQYLVKHSKAKRIVVFSRDELKQSIMQAEMKDDRTRFFLGDVRDDKRLERAFHGVDIVIHAAALKQVPAIEYNPFEAVLTNVIGTQNVIDASINCGVEKAILVSSDKAAHPVNLYGATKLCAEKLFIGGNSYAAGKTKFSCVRYGNVLGSRGSIIDILLRRKKIGGITITDERMTRFWIDLEKTIEIVTFTLTHMEGGEIFVPKAPTMKIKDLFDTLAPKVKKKIIGIRPGEKLHEVLLTKDEARHTLEYKNYYVILPEQFPSHSDRKFNKIKSSGKNLDGEFVFASDSNDVFLDKKELLKAVKKISESINKQGI